MSDYSLEQVLSANQEILKALDRVERKLDGVFERMATKDDIHRFAKKLDAVRV